MDTYWNLIRFLTLVFHFFHSAWKLLFFVDLSRLKFLFSHLLFSYWREGILSFLLIFYFLKILFNLFKDFLFLLHSLLWLLRLNFWFKFSACLNKLWVHKTFASGNGIDDFFPRLFACLILDLFDFMFDFFFFKFFFMNDFLKRLLALIDCLIFNLNKLIDSI